MLVLQMREGDMLGGGVIVGGHITNTYYDCAGDREENTVQHITIGKIPKIPAGDSINDYQCKQQQHKCKQNNNHTSWSN